MQRGLVAWACGAIRRQCRPCAVGGFAPLALHEDVALVAGLERAGYRIAWSHRPRVTTSSRLDNRVADGFAGHLLALALQSDA
jgi:hypothetical protein